MIRFLALAAALSVAAIATPASANPPVYRGIAMPSFANPAFAVDPAAASYCGSTGGHVEVRTPFFGTNDPPSQQLQLNGTAGFCRWISKKDGSRIYVLLSTLNSTLPTLAALAYYAKVPLSKAPCSGGANPSSCYCTYLGGSDQFGGANLAGGAWVLRSAPVDTYLQTCIFPDLSSIDSWGLAYHSAGIIRGIDLSKVLRYHHKP